MLRRSKRTRTEKSCFSPQKLEKEEKSSNNKIKETTKTNLNSSFHISDSDSSKKDYEICIGCGTDKIEVETDWIECNNCRCWWHCACAGISNRDSVKYTKYYIKFTCAFCIIRKDNIIRRAENITKKETNSDYCPIENSSITNRNNPEIKRDIVKQTPSNSQIKTENQNLVLIVDNIENSNNCTNSKDIRKEISRKGKGDSKIKFSYKLPLGGIALQFQNIDDKTKFQERDSKEIFGLNSTAHNPAKNTKDREIVGFIKNIPLNINLDHLKKEIENQTESQITDIHRLKFWDTKKPMKVAKIIFDSPSDLNRATQFEITDVIEEQTIKIEKRRSYKFVRCFKCQHLGHASNQCTSNKHCHNCGSENCSENWCSKPSLCRNCKGNHKSSSSNCPEFIKFVNQHKFRNSI